MAVAFASIGTSGFVTAQAVTITKPTGLAAGDLMLVQLSIVSNPASWSIGNIEIAGSWTVPSGFTLLESVADADNDTALLVWGKIATSGDAAASNFTFTGISGSAFAGATTPDMRGDMYRLTGAGGVSDVQITLSGTDDSTDATQTVSSITPTFANSLFILCICSSGADGTPPNSFSGYSIVTSNPTWTEQFDVNTGGGEKAVAGATALRAADTATGTATITVEDASGPSSRSMALIAIPPAVNATGTVVLHTAAAEFFNVTGSSGSTGTATLLEADPYFPDQSGKATDPRWTDETRPDGAWINTPKP